MQNGTAGGNGGSGLGLSLSGPRISDPGKPWRGEGETGPDEDARRTARVLVVDDEPHVRSMMGSTLERHGYDVKMVSSGREALEALEKESFDLILTDIVMQDVNGIALLESVHGAASAICRW